MTHDPEDIPDLLGNGHSDAQYPTDSREFWQSLRYCYLGLVLVIEKQFGFGRHESQRIVAYWEETPQRKATRAFYFEQRRAFRSMVTIIEKQYQLGRFAPPSTLE